MPLAALPISFDNLALWQFVPLYLAMAAFIIWLGKKTLTGIEHGRKWTAVVVRLLLVLVLLLLLAGLQFNRVNHDLSVVVLRDVSRSVQNVHDPDLPQRISQYLKQKTTDKKPGDSVGQISFDGAAQVDAIPTASPDLSRAPVHEPVDGTNIGSAIQLGLATLPSATMGRMLLFSDGNPTQGDLDAALDSAAAKHVPIDVMPLRYSVEHEIMAERLDVPASRAEADPVNLDLIVYSHNPGIVSAKLQITDRGQPIPGFQMGRQILLAPGANSEHISLGKLPAGAHYFRATVEGEPGSDTIADNNSADGVTLVKGASKVLCIDDSPSAEAFAKVLRDQGIQVDRKSVDEFPHDLLALQPYQAIILSNVARGPGGIDETQDHLLSDYVQNLGGGLLMIGGPNTFGAGGWIGSQVEKILPVNCQPPEHHVMPAGGLVLVIDHSGSMSESIHNAVGSKEQYADEAAVLALRSLMDKDYIGVIAFDTQPTWIVKLAPNDQPEKTSQQIRGISPAGGTDMYPALEEAYNALVQLDSEQFPIKHIVLLTDGMNNFPRDFSTITTKMRAANITLSTVGIGDDADQRLLGSLARMGKGKFYFVEDPKILPQVFVKEAMTLRATLIKEKTFVPRVRDGDSPVLAGVDGLPPLTGLISTWPKANPTIVQPLISDEADPLLSYWRVGLGQCAAFTSDTGDRWAGAWTQWPGYGKFFSQIVRTIERGFNTTLASARIVPTTPGHAKLIVEAIGAQQKFADFLNVWAMLITPDPHAKPQSIQLNQTGPGSYAADIATPATGAYLAAVHLDRSSGNTWIDAAYVAPASPEMRDLQSNDFLLNQIAQRTGGRLLQPFDASDNLFDRDGLTEPRIARPLTNYLIAAAIVLLLLDVAVRRISIDRRMLQTMRGYLGSYVHTPPGRSAALPQINAMKKATPAATATYQAPSESEQPVIVTAAPPARPEPEPSSTDSASSLDRLAAAKRRARGNFKDNG